MLRLLYISYWPYWDGLTQSTVLPNLELLAESQQWEKVIFTSLESAKLEPVFLHPKIVHQPFHNNENRFKMLDRFSRWTKYKRFLKGIIKSEKVDCIIARCAPAGIMASELGKSYDIPFYVESFEPHSDYMEESGVWSKWDPRYVKQRLGEIKVRKRAKGLITVSDKFRNYLEQKGVDGKKIQVVPCSVDTQLFRFSADDRFHMRQHLQIPLSALVGINVGKYGGIYHDETAFTLFQFLFRQLPTYYQIFISHDVDYVKARVAAFGLPEDRCKVITVKNSEVPKYLSATDFGFVLVKTTPAKQFCSPIKTGEYWACGLPVIITEAIGDDSDIIAETGTGVVWDAKVESMPMVLSKINGILIQPNLRERNLSLALKHRNRNRIAETYSYFKLI